MIASRKTFGWILICLSWILGQCVMDDDQKLKSQLLTDVYMLKLNLMDIQRDLSNVKKNHASETDIIAGVKASLTNNGDLLQKCRLDDEFNDLATKMNRIKQKIQNTINDNDDKHTDMFDRIMVHVKMISNNCASNDNETSTNFHRAVMEKLLHLDGFNERLQKLQNIFQNHSVDAGQQLNSNASSVSSLLNEIKSNLIRQEEKLIQIETLQPIVQNSINSLELHRKSECNRKKCIVRKILELTRNSTDIS
ncbi:uncharacterized protein LOC142236220 [Haematobia irritans]|uniref:uncharacterized protein LOC142236220 n=1 Tax=Haematobia irritans TaxID=7368 RepID=UPI003F506502